MDGRNCIGRRISLLNESEAPAHAISSSRSDRSTSSSSSNRLPSLPRSLHSRASSYASSPALSPQTPPLSRSDSSDSQIMQIPSPVTPDFTFDATFPLHQGQQLPSPLFSHKNSFFPHMPKEAQSLAYPPIPQPNSAFAYPQPPVVPVPQQQPAYMPVAAPVSAPAPASPSKASESKAGSSAKPQSKKNHYPCPMAKQYNCPDYFTTSGHAARHAKKHTGRKDAVCPECNKAFTRKDNMEQHRRTHQNGRNSQKGGEDASQPRKAKSSISKRPRPTISPLQSSATAMAPLDPLLPTSPGSSIAFSDALQPLQSFTSPYMEPIPYRYDLPTSFTAGLDTLAIVATGEDRKRKYDE